MKLQIFASAVFLVLISIAAPLPAAAATWNEIMCSWGVSPASISVGQQFNVSYSAGANRDQPSTLTVSFFLSADQHASGGYFLGSDTVFIQHPGPFCSTGESMQLLLDHPAIDGCLAPENWYIIFTVGDDATSAGFSVPAPTITSFSPTGGVAGTTVEISGSGFFGTRNVQFDGVDAPFVFNSDTSLTAEVPAGATTGEIRIVKSCLQLSSGADFFVPAPVIADFTPKVGSVGSFVRVTGSSFSGLTGMSFNGVPVINATFNDTAIDAEVPPGATDGPIAVTTGETAVSSVGFVVDPHCASYARYSDDSRVDSVRFGTLEHVNDSIPGCASYTDNSNQVAHVAPGQTGLPIQVRQGSCSANDEDKVTKVFVDWNGNQDFSDPGEEMLVSTPLGNALLVGSLDVPPAAPLGTARMRVVTTETGTPSAVTACGIYNRGETQDYTLEIAACAASLDLPVGPEGLGQWHMISLPCDPGAANTVQELFGDDLTGTYGPDWVVFDFDEATQQYSVLGLGDALELGRSYWIATRVSGQSIGVGGQPNPQAVGVHGQSNGAVTLPLVTDAGQGRYNMVGHPFAFPVDWADVEVLLGADVLSLDDVDPLVGIPAERACSLDPPHPSCVMSRLAYRWNGAAYEPLNGETPGAEGTLEAFDGLWVKAFQSGISLRIPATPSRRPQASSSTQGVSDAGGWLVRLIVEAAGLRDTGSVLGQLAGSARGYDVHDLPELPPFGDTYLSVVFPHPEWGDRADDYATDFHPRAPLGSRDEWFFEVVAGNVEGPVTLRWEGPPELLRRMRLIDEETGAVTRVQSQGRYSFELGSGRRGFRWVVEDRVRSTANPGAR